MWWHWYLLLGLIILGAGWLVRDARCQWVAGLWCMGILAMQVHIGEPWHWVYAFALWTLVALFVGLRIGAVWSALFMAAIPLGYAALAVDSLMALGTEGRILAFTITEAAGVVAVIVGGSGLPNGFRRLGRARDRNRGIGILGARRALAYQENAAR